MQDKNVRSRDEKGQINGLNYSEQKNISLFSIQNIAIPEKKTVKAHNYQLCYNVY